MSKINDGGSEFELSTRASNFLTWRVLGNDFDYSGELSQSEEAKQKFREHLVTHPFPWRPSQNYAWRHCGFGNTFFELCAWSDTPIPKRKNHELEDFENSKSYLNRLATRSAARRKYLLHIQTLRHEGNSFREIGIEINLSGQRARQLFRLAERTLKPELTSDL